MALVQHVHPWDSQPQEAAAIAPDWVNLVDAAWTPANGANLVGLALSISPTVYQGVSDAGPAGRVQAFNGSSEVTYWRLPNFRNGYPIFFGGEITWPDTPTPGAWVMGLGDADYPTSSLLTGIRSEAGVFTSSLRLDWASGINDLAGPSIVVGRPYKFVRVAWSPTEHELYVNGQLFSNSGDGAGWGTFSYGFMSMGGLVRAGTVGGYGLICAGLFFYGFNTRATRKDLSDLSINPWQLFAPRTQYIPTASGVLVPTLSLSTFVPGSLGATGWRPQVTTV